MSGSGPALSPSQGLDPFAATWRGCSASPCTPTHQASTATPHAAQGFVLDVKGILGSDTDIRAVAQEMLTQPRKQSLESGARAWVGGGVGGARKAAGML